VSRETLSIRDREMNERLWGLRVWNIVRFDIEVPPLADVTHYEETIKSIVLANQAVQFVYEEQEAL
jgi:hypothetical protein